MQQAPRILPTPKITLNHEIIQDTTNFKYLSSMLTADGSMDAEVLVQQRLIKAQTAFSSL